MHLFGRGEKLALELRIDFVAGVQESLGQVVEALLAAAGYQYLSGFVVKPVFPLELGGNGGAGGRGEAGPGARRGIDRPHSRREG